MEFYDFSFKILLNNGEDVCLKKNKSSAAKIRRKLWILFATKETTVILGYIKVGY